ncbi:MAG: NTP transferase domain-containing protein [Halodesulfurarchaeum sp.]
MDALVMCGGRGTRLAEPVEKPLFEICHTPMLQHVLLALAGSRVESIVGVGSPHTPATTAAWGDIVSTVAPDRQTRFVVAGGDGYVSDLDEALETVDRPVVTVASDLPLLESERIDRVIGTHGRGSTTVMVPLERKRELGVTIDRPTQAGSSLVPAGLNVVGVGKAENRYVSRHVGFAVNVNRTRDARIAEAIECNSS